MDTFPQRALLVTLMLGATLFSRPELAQAQSPALCQVQPVSFEGWKAQQLSNRWVKLAIVPQLGGRLMQVTLGDHPYLFVNPKLKGKYFPPSEGTAKGRWFNYGGDKIWPLPEGNEDEQHWPGPVSDVLDDGDYTLKVFSERTVCYADPDGPAVTSTVEASAGTLFRLVGNRRQRRRALMGQRAGRILIRSRLPSKITAAATRKLRAQTGSAAIALSWSAPLSLTRSSEV